MKKLTCEMCGSTDLMKDGGVFICQTCGCKYSVEEARRMMVEGTVDVKGTVQIDNSSFVKKYLENARRAKEKEDWEETEKYYNLVEQNDPNNIEAIFYSSYGKAKASLVDGDIYKRQAVFKVLNNCVSIIDDKYQIEDRAENEVAIRSMALDLLKLFGSNFVFTEWKNGYGVVTRTNKGETYSLFVGLIDAFHNTMLNIQRKDPQAYMYDVFIAFCEGCKSFTFEGYNKAGLEKIFNEWIEQQKKAKVNAYWAEHKEEKAQLDSEKASLNKKIDDLKKSIDALPETIAVKEIKNKIEQLNKQKDSLGLFKGKEKKALQEQIDKLAVNLASAEKAEIAVANPIWSEVNSLSKRVSEIDNKLSNAR